MFKCKMLAASTAYPAYELNRFLTRTWDVGLPSSRHSNSHPRQYFHGAEEF